MPIAYLTTRGLEAKIVSERLELKIPSRTEGAFPKQKHIPLADIEHIVLDYSVNLSLQDLSKLLSRKIPVHFVAQGRMPAGVALPMNQFVLSKAQQIDACRNLEFCLENAKNLVVAKVQNQKRVLQRLHTNRGKQFIGAGWFDSILRDAKNTESLDSLRGFEGACAGRYFELLNSFFPEGLLLERRSRQPPHNEVNAILSYVYTILLTEITSHVYATGLEPGWGFFHQPDDNKPSLALDLLEPFRAPVADALCLDLMNHKRLKKEDFEYRNGGCFLKRESRRKLFVALEDRLEREFSSEQIGHRTTLRQTIIRQCYDIKRAFNNEGKYVPFLMN